MTHRVTWETSRAGKIDAMADAISWLYPRPIERFEIEYGWWFRWGDHVVFWYQFNGDTLDLVLHVCIEPQHRGMIYPREWKVFAAKMGEILGADRLLFPSGVGKAPVQKMLRKWGWKDYEGGLALELPPRRTHGKAPEAEEAEA